MGKRVLTALVLLAAGLLAAGRAHGAPPESRLMRYPDIHGDLIVFTYGSDLWTAPAEGGTAARLTTHAGPEVFAKFSPDGSTIAFTGFYDGNSDVYTIPATGGEPRRLTFHPIGDLVVDWHPDGTRILFRSMREAKTNPGPRYRRLYTIGTAGGYPEALPLFEGELASWSPDGRRLAFNRWSREFRTWKRYQGGMAQDIWLFDLETNRSERLTDYEGTDAFPMWHGDRIYFISDRERTMNIYCLELDSRAVRKITNHGEYDVKWPSLGGDAIVYENGGHLYVLNLETEKTRRVRISVPSDQMGRRPRHENAAGQIRSFALSGTGKRAIFSARGDIFTVPAEKGEVRNLTRTPGVRERSPVYSPDGKWIAHLSDISGEYEIYTMSSDGSGEPRRITKGLHNWPYQLAWSPDSRKILFHDQTLRLCYVDIDAGKIMLIDEDPFSPISDCSWSADSKWVAYARNNEAGFTSIYLYNLDEDRSRRVTSDMYNDYDPVFDPDGAYLFFVSDRGINFSFRAFEFEIGYETPSVICVATLKADMPSLLAPESDEVEIGLEMELLDIEAVIERLEENGKRDRPDRKRRGAKQEDEESKKDEAEARKKPALEIDFEGLEERIVALPVGRGNFIGLVALEGKLLFARFELPSLSYDAPQQPHAAILYFDYKQRKSETIIAGINGYDVSADGKKLLYSSPGNLYGIVDIAPGKKVGDGMINTGNLMMRLDPLEEWRQIFHEAWRMQRDFFYAENMHGVDWNRMKKRYEVFLPFLTDRDDLNYIIGEMIAELNVGHAYVGGGDYRAFPTVPVGLLGCDFEVERKSGRYRIAKIYGGRNWEPLFRAPLAQPGIAVMEGDYLIAINGVDLKYPANPFELLEHTSGRQTLIKVAAKPDGKEAREYTVEPAASDINLRYDDWVESNRRRVLEASGGRIGYVHVPSTAVTGIHEFGRQFFPQAGMDGIVVDVRYNSGGWMPSIFVDRLGRKVQSYWLRRHGTVMRFPSTAPVGHLVCLINERAGSGGDAFPHLFRQAGLGPLIGTRTWGGLVGISGTIPMIDGGMVTVPAVAFADLEVEYAVEGVGVAPDIEVDNDPSSAALGIDRQLERGIEYLMKRIAEEPPVRSPKRPKDPDKR